MAGAYSLLLLALTTLALAAPHPGLDARQDTATSTETGTCSAASTISAEAACISGGGTAFVSSVCSHLTSTAVVYSTVIVPHTTTIRSTVATSYSSTRTRTLSMSTTVVTTTTYTSTVRVTSGTTSSLAGSVTQNIVRTTTQYTCPNSAASTVFPTPTSDETSGLRRRQATSTACFPYYSAQYGLEGIIQACRCLRPSSAIATVTLTFAATSTSGTVTATSPVTLTGRSTASTTRTITRTSVITSSIEISTTVRTTIPYISTIRSTSTTTLTSAYPLPTGRFRIYMRVNGEKLYGKNVQAASNTSGTDVIALSTDSSSAASWGFNNLLNLILAGAQTKIAVEQNTWDVPFVYLLPGGLPLPDPWTAPTFAPCNGTLVPTGGESSNIFAACASGNDPNRKLAFGPPGIWNSNVNNQGDAADAVQNGTCVTGPLGIEAVSGSLIPTQSTESSTSTPISDSISTTADDTSTDTSTASSSSSSSTNSDTTTTSETTTNVSTTFTSPTDTSSSTSDSSSTTEDKTLPTGPLARAPMGY